MTVASTCCNWLAVCAFGLAACQPSGAQAPRPAPTPTEQDIASAYHPAYKSPADARSECLGRLVFEVPSQPRFEWGLPQRARTNEEILGFSRILQGGQDSILMANVAVVVAAGATSKTILEMQGSVQTDKSIALQDLEENIRRRLSLANSQEALTNDPNYKNDLSQVAGLVQDAKRLRTEAEALKSQKIAVDKDWHPTDWGLPDSTGYIAGPTLYAFLLRDGFAFQFMSTGARQKCGSKGIL